MAEVHSITDMAACSTEFFSARIESLREALSTVDMNDDEARVEAEIEASKVHWSELTSAYVTAMEVPTMESTSTLASDLARTSEVERVWEQNQRVAKENVEVFRSLQAMYPGGFFVDETVVGPDHVQKLPWWLVDEDGKSPLVQVKLSSEKPFAEGAQAYLFDAHVVFHDGERREGLAMKVFKEGTSLRDLQSWLPPSILNDKRTQENGWFRAVGCNILIGARLLNYGRFAFLMFKACGDLRGLMDDIMLQKCSMQGAPFRDDVALRCISLIAMGMQSLHARGIVHRDLKAANVLIGSFSGLSFSDPKPLDRYDFACHVADFECSIGVVGTGFWRAPEILLAVKNRNYHENPEIFSKQADVYSFGMTCYEILTGRIPFEEVLRNDYDKVIGGARPILPKETPQWLVNLVKRCWDEEPHQRPTFDEVLLVLGDVDRYLFGR